MDANHYYVMIRFSHCLLHSQLCNVRLGGAMHAVAITEEFSEPHSFTIVTPQTTLYLRAESTDEMLNWITLFNNAATQSRRRPTNPITVSQPAPSEATTNKLDSNTPSIVAPAVQSTANGGEQHTDVSISDQNARILAIASRPENKKCADCRDVGSLFSISSAWVELTRLILLYT
jgi:hypothetical protein